MAFTFTDHFQNIIERRQGSCVHHPSASISSGSGRNRRWRTEPRWGLTEFPPSEKSRWRPLVQSTYCSHYWTPGAAPTIHTPYTQTLLFPSVVLLGVRGHRLCSPAHEGKVSISCNAHWWRNHWNRSLCYQHALLTQPHFDGDEWCWERRQASTNASGEDRTAGIFTRTLTVNYPRQHRKRHMEVLLAQPAGETLSLEEAGTWPSCDWLTAKGANVCCFLEGSELIFALEGKLNEILRRMTLPRLLLAKAKMKAH